MWVQCSPTASVSFVLFVSCLCSLKFCPSLPCDWIASFTPSFLRFCYCLTDPRNSTHSSANFSTAFVTKLASFCKFTIKESISFSLSIVDAEVEAISIGTMLVSEKLPHRLFRSVARCLLPAVRCTTPSLFDSLTSIMLTSNQYFLFKDIQALTLA